MVTGRRPVSQPARGTAEAWVPGGRKAVTGRAGAGDGEETGGLKREEDGEGGEANEDSHVQTVALFSTNCETCVFFKMS